MKTTSNVYGSMRTPVNRPAMAVFSGGTQFNDITKLIKGRPRHKKIKPIKQIDWSLYKMPGLFSFSELSKPTPRHCYPPIDGDAFESPRNLALHIIAALAGIDVSDVFENRTHFVPELMCFSHIGAFSNFASDRYTIDEWNRFDFTWAIRSSFRHFDDPFMKKKFGHLVHFDINPHAFLSLDIANPCALCVKVNRIECDFVRELNLHLFEKLRGSSSDVKLKRIVTCVRDVAQYVSNEFSQCGAVSTFAERQERPLLDAANVSE